MSDSTTIELVESKEGRTIGKGKNSEKGKPMKSQKTRAELLLSGKKKAMIGIRKLVIQRKSEAMIAELSNGKSIRSIDNPRKEQSPIEKCCKIWRAPLQCILHVSTLWLVWLLTLNCIWTFDSFDAVSLIERELLQSESSYNHQTSEYDKVDSLSSLDEWMTNTVGFMFREIPNRPLLRYYGDDNTEKMKKCVPKINNISYPLEDKGDDTNKKSSVSYNYRVLRPIVDTFSSRDNRQQFSSTYMADGFLIRQVRGSMVGGKLKEMKEPKIFCNRPYRNNPTSSHDSVMSGLYVDYPTSRGYDIYFSADTTHQNATNTLKDALDCGYLDENTRAILVTTTFTTFSKLPPANDHHVINENNLKSAFGAYVDVSLSILYEIPQPGIVRGWHSIVVTDRTNDSYGIETEYNLVVAIAILMLVRCLLYYFEMKVGHGDDNKIEREIHHCMESLKFLSVVIWIFALIAYIQSFEQLADYLVTTDEDELYFSCSSQGELENNSNAGRKATRVVFLFLFGLFALLQCWEVLDYVSFFPKIMVPVRTITAATKEVGIFLIVYVILIFGLCLFLHVIFGELRRFSTIGKTITTILLVTLDQLEIDDIFHGTQHEGRLKTNISMITLRLLLQVIFLNNFVAIVLVQYEIARNERRVVSTHQHKRFLSIGVKTTRILSKCRQFICNKCCCCCLKKSITDDETKEYLTFCFRSWYNSLRTSEKSDKQPLRHDTEVIMKEIRKVMRIAKEMEESQRKLNKEIHHIKLSTKHLGRRLNIMNNEILKVTDYTDKVSKPISDFESSNSDDN